MEISILYSFYKQCSGICTDTREINPGSMYVALKGARFNGNNFALEALKKGASFAVVDEQLSTDDPRVIVVNNALKTLQHLATHHRNTLGIPIISLTGSNGKTTSKELLHAILSKKFKTAATVGNLNNAIGVPLTLLSFATSTEIGIVEMGANHQKEIAFLCEMTLPDYGYINNFGKAHLEGFGGFSGVVKGKSELYDYLRKNKKEAFVNSNDPLQLENSKGTKRHFFGTHVTLKDVAPFVSVNYQGNCIQSHLIGHYNFQNLHAAIAIGNHFGVSSQDIKEAIENYVPTNNRSQILQKGNATIVLDAYNANPSSMEVALENFQKLEAPYKTVVLGDMFELGTASKVEHERISKLAIDFDFDEIHLIGTQFSKTKTSKAITYTSFEVFKNAFQPNKKGLFLIKGSRGMALERMLDLFD
jgi:UDP-N-acetylmuramoyl-tripeptide--D-alanyl-D-alanine ligase